MREGEGVIYKRTGRDKEADKDREEGRWHRVREVRKDNKIEN